MKRRKKKQKKEKVFGLLHTRNLVAKNNEHKPATHKSKKDYDRRSLVQKLKNYLKWE